MHLSFAGAVVGMLIGLGAMAAPAIQLLAAIRARSWIRVHARILSATHVQRENVAASASHELSIEYEYQFGAARYVGRRLGFGPIEVFGTQSAAESALSERYPVGADIHVRIDPLHPEASVVRPGLAPQSLIQMLLGAFVAALSLSVLVGSSRR